MIFRLQNKRLLLRFRIFFRSKTWSNVLVFLAFTALAVVFRFSMSTGKDGATGDIKTADTVTIEKSSLKENIIRLKTSAKAKETGNATAVDTVVVPVVCRGLPADRRVRFFPPEVHLTVIAGDGRQHKVDETDFEVDADYSCLRDTTRRTCPLTVSRKPRWAAECRISPSEVEFLFE